MTELPNKPRGLARWPWRAAAWTIAVALAIDCASLVAERWKPRLPEPGPNLVNWNGPGLTPAQEFATEIGFFSVLNLALLATILGMTHVIGRIRQGKPGRVTVVLAVILLPFALIGVGGNLVLFLSMFR
jgi:hypothetical protein